MKKNKKTETGGKTAEKTCEKQEKPAKRGRGRPRHPAGLVRDYEIRVRVTQAETRQLAAQCHAAGQTLTGYVRARCGLPE